MGSGEQLLLIHGLGSHYKVWEPVMDRLTAEFEVVGVDLPGFGDSPPLPDDGTPDAYELTDAVQAFMDEIGWDRPHIAGNSLGGWIGLELAKRGRASSVAAIGPAGFGNKRERAFTVESLRTAHRITQLTYGIAPRLMASATGRKLMLSQNFVHAERMTPEAAVATARNFADSPGVPGALEALRQGHFSGGEQIDVPVTMIWGERERLLPRRQRQAARSLRAVPGARLVWLRGCGHVPVWDDPQQVAQAVLEATKR
jgi:pimeloyl-ACP methyl ester carboxylesterase